MASLKDKKAAPKVREPVVIHASDSWDGGSWTQGNYATAAEAVEAVKRIIREDVEAYTKGATSEQDARSKFAMASHHYRVETESGPFYGRDYGLALIEALWAAQGTKH
jgi:hypothetical protein